ncbi:MAG: SpoIVB peptidase S55 domain-containing protein [Thermoanaerobaculia bacterium]
MIRTPIPVRSAVAAAILAWSGALVAAQEAPAPSGEILPLDNIQAGQRGYGLSVFQGTEPERFEVEVLGVLRNQAPDQSYILARLSGRNLEATGVVAGMSGSPVYIDGRLAGAVSFSFPFADDPVAGITPIESMMGMSDASQALPSAVSVGAMPDVQKLLEPAADAEALVTALARLHTKTADGRVAGVEWVGQGFAGLSHSLLERGLGALALSGSAQTPTGQTPTAQPTLVPGSAVAGLLVDGDLRLAATGTVTERLDDGRVLAFGHPFLGLGSIELPMAAAEVVTVVDNQLSSFKIANVGEVVGAFDLDRLPGLRGQIGRQARMVPLQVTVHDARQRRFDLRVARIPSLTPTLVAISTLGSLDSASSAAGTQGLDLTFTADLAGHPQVRLEQSFDGPQAAMQAVLYVLAAASFLEQNPWAELGIERVGVELTRHAQPRIAQLVDAYASRTVVRPGDTVRLTAELRAWRGDIMRRSLELTVPPALRAGRYHLLVGDGPSIDGMRLAVEQASPVHIRQALELLAGLHSRRELVMLGLFSDRGLSVAGEALPQLPGSLQSLWAAAGSGSAATLQLAIGQQQVVSLDVPVQGVARVTLEVRRRQPLGGEESRPEPTEPSRQSTGEGV